MNIQQLIDELRNHPKDKLLYNALNVPSWHIGSNGEIVLAGTPCPIQTVEQLIHKLKIVQRMDFASMDTTFRRAVYGDTEIYAVYAKEDRNGTRLAITEVNETLVRLWFVFANDHYPVDVALGGPSYVLSNDKVKVLVNKPYYDLLSVNSKRHYLTELLGVHAFSWQDTRTGEQKWMNKEYWLNGQCSDHIDEAPQLEIKSLTTGFNTVRHCPGTTRTPIKHTSKNEGGCRD